MSLSFVSAFVFFFFNDTATTEIYTLSLHDALPISDDVAARVRELTGGAGLAYAFDFAGVAPVREQAVRTLERDGALVLDRKSTRLNSSHANISYAVFCLKKKNKA